MNSGTRPLLERHEVFRSHDAEETRAFLDGKGFRLRDLPHGSAVQLDVRLHGVYLPGSSPGRDCTYIGYIQYGAPVAVSAGPERQDYWVELPVQGHLEVTEGQDRTVHDSTRGCVMSPTRYNRFNLIRSEGCSARI